MPFFIVALLFHSFGRPSNQNVASWGLYVRRAVDVKTNWNELSDNELARIARNDHAAFGILYDRYLTAVYRYCLRRINDRSDAEDATSATFIRACERIGSFRGGSFPAWLFSIARTTVIDSYRVNRGFQSTELLQDTIAAVDPALDHIEEDSVGTVRTLIRLLTPEQQEVIELRLSGLNISEAAVSIGKSVPATKMLQLRALKRLRIVAIKAGLIQS